MDFKENFEQTVNFFNELVKEELEKILKAEIISIENEAGSESQVTTTLDLQASSDLIIKYQDDSSVYTASNRILKIKKEYAHLPISITIRNSIDKEYDKTEANKLKFAHDKILHNIPVVMPKTMCNSRLIYIDGDYKLLDIIVVETMPLIECIFSHKGLNLSLLRQEHETKGHEIVFDKDNKNKAGIRNNKDGKTSFIYINKEFLDEFNIPYKYENIYSNQKNESEDDIKESENSSDSEIVKFIYDGKPMPDYFSEKSQQVSQDSFVVFDIQISSRYGQYGEISNMMNFAYDTAKINATHFVESIYYDSKAGTCVFTFSDEIYDNPEVEIELLKIAKKYLFQFIWLDDRLEHGVF